MLNVVTVREASDILKNRFPYSLASEELFVENAFGRILAEDIVSGEMIPAFNRSTVDGFALKSSDTYGAGENMPSFLKIKIILSGTEFFILNSTEYSDSSTI